MVRPAEHIASRILVVRGQRVMVDADLAFRLRAAEKEEVGLFVLRAFVRMREVVASHRELVNRLDERERKVGTHDRAIGQILEAIRQLTQPPETQKRRRIGFL